MPIENENSRHCLVVWDYRCLRVTPMPESLLNLGTTTRVSAGETRTLDWFSRYVVSWRLSNTQDTLFCLQALVQAFPSKDGITIDTSVVFQLKNFAIISNDS